MKVIRIRHNCAWGNLIVMFVHLLSTGQRGQRTPSFRASSGLVAALMSYVSWSIYNPNSTYSLMLSGRPGRGQSLPAPGHWNQRYEQFVF